MRTLPVVGLTLLLVASLSCGNDDDGPTGPNGPAAPTTGGILVSLVMSGHDMDADGCSVAVDSGSTQQADTGATIVFSDLSAGTHELAIGDVAANCQVDGSTSRSVTVVAGQTVQETFTVVCHWASQIAFTRGDFWLSDGHSEIYVMNPDGSGQENLTNYPSRDFFPAWSPDGTRVAFSRSDGGPAIHVMNSDGTGQVRLTPGFFPAWSPDGTRIAFTREHGGGDEEVWVMNADGTGLVNLTNHGGEDRSPAWSPDGTRIAYTSQYNVDDHFAPGLSAMNADGTGVVNLTSTGERDPAWSPDGSRIAFVRLHDGTGEIYVMNANGTGQVRLTYDPSWDSSPRWSPDGTRIAFSSRRDGNSEIYVMNADGTGVVNLTDHPEPDSYPAWSPILY